MSAQQLQQLMIINKTKQLKWNIRLKSVLLSALTWLVWCGTFAMFFMHADHIIQRPLIEMYYIGDVISMMFAVVLALMLCAVFWSFINKTKLKD